MFFFSNRGFSIGNRPPTQGMGTGMLLNGIMCILFGLCILAAPELLAYLVATFLIFIGGSILMMWWRFRNWMK